jgi:hypothetical protein
LLLAGPTANASTLTDLHAAAQKFATASPLFEAAIALATRRDLPGEIGHLEPDAAALLGVEGHTLLALRPDGYIGLRADTDHLSALEHYHTLVQTGRS